jgi:hypothetical protein
VRNPFQHLFELCAGRAGNLQSDVCRLSSRLDDVEAILLSMSAGEGDVRVERASSDQKRRAVGAHILDTSGGLFKSLNHEVHEELTRFPPKDVSSDVAQNNNFDFRPIQS